MAACVDSRTQTLTGYLIFHTFVASLGGLNAGINLGNLNTPGQLISQCKDIPVADRSGNGGNYAPCWAQKETEETMKSIWGFVAGLLAVGGLIGALASTPLATRLGRKYAIMVNNLMFIAGAACMAISNGPIVFGIGRFLSGIATGAATSIVSMYISEISTAKYRGALGACMQLNLVIGILAAAGFGMPLSKTEVNSANGLGWRINVAIVAAPALLQMCLMFLCVETPAFLVSKGRLVEAKAALQKLRGHIWNVDYEFADLLKSQGYSDEAAGVPASNVERKERTTPEVVESNYVIDCEREVNKSSDPANYAGTAAIEKNLLNAETGSVHSATSSVHSATSQNNNNKSGTMSFFDIVRDVRLRNMLLIAVGIHFCQQITGINSIIMYSTSIFEKAYPNSAGMLTLGVSLVNLACTVAAILFVDKFGRKTLMGFGLLGMTAFTGMVVAGQVFNVPLMIVLGINLFVACFSVGLGPIPFLIIPELFPTRAVAVAAGLANFVNYLSNWLVVLTFPMYEVPLGDYVFLPFLALAALGTIFVFTCVPETKGKSLKDLGIADEWSQK